MKDNKMLLKKIKSKLSKKNILLKKWLQENKIYFETIMIFSLTLMGVVISLLSLSIDKRMEELQNREYELERLNLNPVFNVTSEEHHEAYTVNGIQYSPCIEYRIINNGANLNDAYLRTMAAIEITLTEDDGNTYFLILENTQRFSDSYSYYDADEKSFTIRKEFDNRYVSLKNYLFKTLEKEYSSSQIVTVDYINIQYTDLEGNFYNEWYELIGDELYSRNPVTTRINAYCDITTMDNEDVYIKIKEILETL